MPVTYNIPNMAQTLLAQSLRRFSATLAIRSKRPRRAVSYADELLARAAARIALQRAQAKR